MKLFFSFYNQVNVQNSLRVNVKYEMICLLRKKVSSYLKYDIIEKYLDSAECIYDHDVLIT